MSEASWTEPWTTAPRKPPGNIEYYYVPKALLRYFQVKKIFNYMGQSPQIFFGKIGILLCLDAPLIHCW